MKEAQDEEERKKEENDKKVREDQEDDDDEDEDDNDVAEKDSTDKAEAADEVSSLHFPSWNGFLLLPNCFLMFLLFPDTRRAVKNSFTSILSYLPTSSAVLCG